jgi:hypothetical protein
MPSKIINTLVTNDQAFTVNFKIDNYDKKILSSAILNIWTDLKIALKQEEKINDFLYYYHKIERIDTIDSLSDKYYGTVDYWWLILVSNEITDPFDFVESSLIEGDTIKIIKPQYLNSIIKKNTTFDISDFLKDK